MSDLNVMLREQATLGLQRELDAAVTNGDTEAARKASEKLALLAVQSAPKAPPYGDAEIRAELNKLDWFGVDPVKSGRVIQLGKDMDPKKFPSAEAFAAALVKAVEIDGKPAAPKKDGEGGEDEDEGEEDENEGEDEPKKKQRRTDGPGEGDNTQRATGRRTSGPWSKLSDAPANVQAEIKRQADKFVPANAPKERREGYITRALASHYNAHQLSKGKK